MDESESIHTRHLDFTKSFFHDYLHLPKKNKKKERTMPLTCKIRIFGKSFGSDDLNKDHFHL